MASNLKRAGSAIRKSFRSRRYAMFDAKENSYIDSPQKVKATSDRREEHFRHRSPSEEESDSFDTENTTTRSSPRARPVLRRASSVTQSMRDAVGTLRQKLRMSTRRQTRLQGTPTRAGKRRHTLGGRDVKMSSPFKIDTPSRAGRPHTKTCLSMETPTRLRREVEALTANMQALSALSPNTLQSRARTRKNQPLTNGSLKTPRSTRRQITTDIY